MLLPPSPRCAYPGLCVCPCHCLLPASLESPSGSRPPSLPDAAPHRLLHPSPLHLSLSGSDFYFLSLSPFRLSLQLFTLLPSVLHLSLPVSVPISLSFFSCPSILMSISLCSHPTVFPCFSHFSLFSVHLSDFLFLFLCVLGFLPFLPLLSHSFLPHLSGFSLFCVPVCVCVRPGPSLRCFRLSFFPHPFLFPPVCSPPPHPDPRPGTRGAPPFPVHIFPVMTSSEAHSPCPSLGRQARQGSLSHC